MFAIHFVLYVVCYFEGRPGFSSKPTGKKCLDFLEIPWGLEAITQQETSYITGAHTGFSLI
jgi:hypothetical protein